MKHNIRKLSLALVLLLALTLFLSLASCDGGQDAEHNEELTEDFIEALVENEYSEAYDLVKDCCTTEEFSRIWQILRQDTEGATDFEMHSTGWNIQIRNGIKTVTTTYAVNYNNGKGVAVETITQDGIRHIAGIHFGELNANNGAIAGFAGILVVIGIISFVIGLASLVLMIIAIVDAATREIENKVVWILLIIFLSPISAIIYLCMRKKLSAKIAAKREAETSEQINPVNPYATESDDDNTNNTVSL